MALINLSNNENPWGCSELVKHALQEHLHQPHRYPDSDYAELKLALATHLHVAQEQIILGNGSESILELIVQSLVQPHQHVILSQHAFHTIPLILKNHHVQTKTIPLQHWHDDIDAIINQIEETTRLIFLVNPNNPVGTYTNQTRFEQLMVALPAHVIVVVDEAYFEYVDQADYPNAINYLSKYPNLISTRTFSKCYGLAGLRIGYAVTSSLLAARLNANRLPYNVNSFAAIAAKMALQDHAHVQRVIQLTSAGSQQLITGLNHLQIPYLPINGNFLTIYVGNDRNYGKELIRRGILIKTLEAYDLKGYIRVTISSQANNEQFLLATDQIIDKLMMVK